MTIADRSRTIQFIKDIRTQHSQPHTCHVAQTVVRKPVPKARKPQALERRPSFHEATGKKA